MPCPTELAESWVDEELPLEEQENIIIIPIACEKQKCTANTDEPPIASAAEVLRDVAKADSAVGVAELDDDAAALGADGDADDDATLCSDDEAASNTQGGDGDSDMLDEELGQNLALFSLLQDLKQRLKHEDEGQEATDLQQGRLQGTVLNFAPRRGFGIIAPAGGGEERYFAHWTQISSSDAWPRLAPGAEVEFTPALNAEGRLAAANITCPGGDAVVSVEEVDRIFRDVSDFTVTGEVSSFHRAGHGFIASDTDIDWPQYTPAGSQIYVSREDLVVAEGSACRLAEGMRVEFRVFKPPDKPVAAAEVTAIGGQPLVCPSLPSTTPWQSSTPATRGSTSNVACSTRERLTASALSSGVQRTIQKTAASKVRKFFGEAVQAAATARPLQQDAGGDMTGLFAATPGVADLPAASAAVAVHCKFFAEGRCSKGLSCRFVHSAQEPAQQQALSAGVLPSQPASRARPLASVPCKYFVQGRCAKADLCEFSHDTTEFDPIPLSRKLAEECTFFARGFCSRGAACQFAHGPQELFEIARLKTQDASNAQPP